MQERAEIFLKQHDKWDSQKYINWIMINASKFETITGLKVVNNQKEFTSFLKGGIEEVEKVNPEDIYE